MLMPKKVKYQKQHRGRMKGKAIRAQKVDFGDYGLFSKEVGIVTGRQIESVRVTINRALKRGGKIYLRVFPNIPYTKKPAETRMGKGKGNVEYWVAPIQPGRVMYEIQGVSEEAAREAFRLAAAKLAVRTAFVKRSVL